MSNLVKIMLLGIVGLGVFVGVALPLILNSKASKARLEGAASAALGMEVAVGGRLAVGILQGLHFRLEDVHIRSRGRDVASAGEAGFGLDILSLLRARIRIGRIALKSPRIFIERDLDGRFNLEHPQPFERVLSALDLAEASISDGLLFYVDRQAERGFEAEDCNLAMRQLHLPADEDPHLLEKPSFSGELACGMVRTKDVSVTDLKVSVDAKDGVLDFDPVLMRIFGGEGSGSIQAKFSGAVPVFQVRYSIVQFHIDEFLKRLSPENGANGSMDFFANLSTQGRTWDENKRAAEGEISLRGENLVLDGNDLDKELSRYESSQNFNLVDVGAFFIAGPLGLAVTRGYTFASIFQGSGGSTQIRTLVSDWRVERGIAHARDVAMATSQNRIALRGKLDLVTQQFDDVTVALVDAEGCSRVQQKILGPFQKPVVEKPNVLMSVAGPALNLLNRGRALFPGGQCEVFYAGSVAPPNGEGVSAGPAAAPAGSPP